MRRDCRASLHFTHCDTGRPFFLISKSGRSLWWQLEERCTRILPRRGSNTMPSFYGNIIVLYMASCIKTVPDHTTSNSHRMSSRRILNALHQSNTGIWTILYEKGSLPCSVRSRPERPTLSFSERHAIFPFICRVYFHLLPTRAIRVALLPFDNTYHILT